MSMKNYSACKWLISGKHSASFLKLEFLKFMVLQILNFHLNEKISVFRVRGLKILVRVGTHFFPEKNIILCFLKGILPFKMHKIEFSRKPEKMQGLTSI